jgi:Ca2+-binding EF-hand superfamily protein
MSEEKIKSKLLKELKEAQEQFKKFDKDGSGYIEMDELKEVNIITIL